MYTLVGGVTVVPAYEGTGEAVVCGRDPGGGPFHGWMFQDRNTASIRAMRSSSAAIHLRRSRRSLFSIKPRPLSKEFVVIEVELFGAHAEAPKTYEQTRRNPRESRLAAGGDGISIERRAA